MSKKIDHNTIVDIAKDVGVSVATVSRALNDVKKVKETTRKKILESAKRLNYIPNTGAKSLVQGSSNNIGLLLSDTGSINNQLPSLIDKALSIHGFRLTTYNADNSQSLQKKYMEELIHQRVTGIIVHPIPGDYSFLEYAVAAKIPLIIINRFVKQYSLNHILFDFRIGICQAVDLLVRKRKRKHFFQLALKDVYEGVERRKAFDFAVKANELVYNHNTVYPVQDSHESGYAATLHLLKEHKDVDAILCSSDHSAVGAIRALKDQRVKVPEDVSVVGFYNTTLSDFYDPRISSIKVNIKTFTQTIVKEIISAVKGKTHEQENITLPTEFVEKESS